VVVEAAQLPALLVQVGLEEAAQALQQAHLLQMEQLTAVEEEAVNGRMLPLMYPVKAAPVS
jgi:hypothetical protein